MRKSKIPTFFGLLILIMGLVAGLVLVQNVAFFKPRASADATPKDVRITNITDSSLTVTWVTEKKVLGFLKWGNSPDNLNRVQNPSSLEVSFTHSVTLTSLSADTMYHFRINSDGADFDSNGQTWQVRTGNNLTENESAYLVSGLVTDANDAPVANALVYLTVGGGSPVSTTTTQSGTWVLSISNIRTQNLGSFIDFSEKNSLIDIFVNAGPDGIATAKVFPVRAKPTPPIILGRNHDFRDFEVTADTTIPDANLELPDEISKTSRFNIGGGGTTSSQSVTITSLAQGEIINTTKPEFFGTGPAGTTISITVESEIVSGQALVGSNGTWRWSPSSNLSPGSHKLILDWKDTSGITKTITRNFVVQASDGLAFESTPSGSLAPSATPTPTPTPSGMPPASAEPLMSPQGEPTGMPPALPTPTPITPDSPVYDSGTLTPTIILFIMGISTIMLGFFVWKKA